MNVFILFLFFSYKFRSVNRELKIQAHAYLKFSLEHHTQTSRQNTFVPIFDGSCNR